MKNEKKHQKKYIAVFTALLLTVLMIGLGFRTYASAAVSGTVTASTLFVRSGPSTEYSKVTVNGKAVFLSRGDSVAISYATNGWYYVTASFDGQKVKGYVSAAYILTTGAVPTAAPTSTPTPKPTTTPKPTAAPAANEAVTSGFPRNGIVTAGTLNVRDNAGTTGTSIIGKLSKNTMVKLQGVKNKDGVYWYQISYTQDGVTRTGYVSSEFIKPEAAATATPTPKPTTAPSSGNGSGEVLKDGFPRTGSVSSVELNVRKGAGTDNAVMAVLSKGEAVIVEDVTFREDIYWYKVSFYKDGENKTGYVSSKYIKVAAPTATPSPTATPTPKATPTPAIDSTENVVKGKFPRTGTVTADRLNVRKGAGTSYDSVAAVVKTTKVTILSAKKDAAGAYWYEVSFARDGVKQTGYVHSAYVAVDAVAATPVPTQEPSPTKAPTAAPTGNPAVAGEEISRDDIQDDYAFYYYSGMVQTDGAALYKEASTESGVLANISSNTVIMVINQSIDGTEIWYRVAVKLDGKVICGYMRSSAVRLLAGEDHQIAAQLVKDKVRLKDAPSSTGSYVRTEDGKLLSLAVGDVIWILSEETEEKDGTKWFQIRTVADGILYQGYVEEGPVYLQEAVEEPPATPTPVPTATATPTATPSPAATPSNTPGLTNAPEPTVKPEGPFGSEVLPTPVVHKLAQGYYPVNQPGTVTGYGTTKNDYNRIMVAYVEPVMPYSLVCDENDLFISLYGDEVLVLYDKYADSSNNVYRHVGFEYKGRMYYGYIENSWITPYTGEVPEYSGGEELTPSAGGNMTGNQADFEFYLDQQGFPESYKPYLRALHEQYPNWVFEAYHTGLDWVTVIDEESIAGKNLIPKSKSAQWLSFEAGAYDWTKDSHVVYDGSTWVTASRDAIEYYMDPRNFLNESNVFMFEVLRYASSYQDEQGVEIILGGTPFQYEEYSFKDDYGTKNTLTFAQTFIAAAEYSGVSPYHLAARVKQEVVTSATTASNSVSGTVSGYENLYNFYNIGAYHSTAAGGAIINGLKYAKNGASNNDDLNDASLIPWTNQYNAIVGGAHILGVSYINRGQDTIYLQKFNVTDNSTYYHQYMANVEAPYAESKKTASAYSDMANLPIVFSIPVYYNMPEEAVPVPELAYNPNNWLKTLELYNEDGESLQLTPTFNLKTDQVYYLVVDSDDSVVQVEAKAVSSKAVVVGTGFYGLEFGSNTITVTVFAENGDAREYFIIVVRQE
ncbi:MAG: SH3 domain-containing protein [Lachnospiraceae bacterium]|nr:SH3 domain-containing protein [Lachnospiraceae bacterium]